MNWVWAEDTPGNAEPYSPNVDPTFPTSIFWGDTHVHTALSGDAYVLGTRLMPDDAYRFAKGETVRSNTGKKVRLRRPLDFLAVSDHAENLGVLPRLAAGDRSIPSTEVSQRWTQAIADLPSLKAVLQSEDLDVFNQALRPFVMASPAKEANYALDDSFRRTVWEGVIANAP